MMLGLLDISLEINQMIALELSDDIDLRNYRLSCRFANSAADGDKGSFWRRRFLDHYDPPSAGYKVSNLEHKKLYLRRQLRLGLAGTLRKNKLGQEKRSLEVLRELIIESFTTLSRKAHPQLTSRNLGKVHTFVNRSGLLSRIFRGRQTAVKHETLLCTIQLALAHMSLTAGLSSPPSEILCFPESQQMAYSTAAKYPIFDNMGVVDVKLVLHMINFFKYHFLRPDEQLSAPYTALSDCERPQCWAKMLRDGPQKLGTHWKGCYTFVERHQMEHVRSGRNQKDGVVQDQVTGEDVGEAFQDLTLDFPDSSSTPWPVSFEKILQSRSKTIHSAKTRAQKRAAGIAGKPVGEPISFRFEGQGSDNSEPFLATGWLNPLPPQHGVPGWQRMTMMKYYVEDDEYTSPLDALEDSLWAYEGVVLPGGMIIVGRWWHPQLYPHNSDEYTGPFILWNVDKSVIDEGR